MESNLVTIPSVIKMFPTFGLVIFLLGMNPEEIIHKEDRTILVSTETFIGVLFMIGVGGTREAFPYPTRGGWAYKL